MKIAGSRGEIPQVARGTARAARESEERKQEAQRKADALMEKLPGLGLQNDLMFDLIMSGIRKIDTLTIDDGLFASMMDGIVQLVHHLVMISKFHTIHLVFRSLNFGIECRQRKNLNSTFRGGSRSFCPPANPSRAKRGGEIQFELF